ncbi:C2H2-type zinc finger-containing protein, partial [Reticulomyxa filosa]
MHLGMTEPDPTYFDAKTRKEIQQLREELREYRTYCTCEAIRQHLYRKFGAMSGTISSSPAATATTATTTMATTTTTTTAMAMTNGSHVSKTTTAFALISESGVSGQDQELDNNDGAKKKQRTSNSDNGVGANENIAILDSSLKQKALITKRSRTAPMESVNKDKEKSNHSIDIDIN